MIKKIISGGQTGSDRGGLYAAHALGLETGGYAPMRWWAENGPEPELMKFFGLVETELLGYEHRTHMNVIHSDGTVIFGDRSSTGSQLTSRFVQREKKPNVWFDVPVTHREAKRYFLEWVEKNGVVVLNVAGNRESIKPGIQERVTEFLIEALG